MSEFVARMGRGGSGLALFISSLFGVRWLTTAANVFGSRLIAPAFCVIPDLIRDPVCHCERSEAIYFFLPAK